MPYIVFGLNYETAPISVREDFELKSEVLTRLYDEVKVANGTEWMVISTCNRTEIYMYGSKKDAARIRAALEEECGPWPTAHAFDYEAADAVRHIIEVVAGLRSQILGDSQILAQSKDAYRLAIAANNLGPWMHRLIHSAFAAAKRTITETGLGLYGASVAHTAVHTGLARLDREKKDGKNWTALVLGGGHMGSLLIRELAAHSPEQVSVATRHRSRAAQLAKKFGFRDIEWADRAACAAEANLVFVTTGASSFVLTKETLESQPTKELTVLIDIAVPRNVDPDISNLPNYTVVNIDSLLTPNGTKKSTVSQDLEEARMICTQSVDGIMNWAERHMAVQPAIRTLHETFEAIRRREVERNIHRMAESEHDHVERLTKSIMQKLLAIPVVHLKAMAVSDGDFKARIEFLNELFDRSECEEITNNGNGKPTNGQH